MCGIAAIFAHRPGARNVRKEELLAVREAMIPRGPDGAGLWVSEDRRVGLAHRRLAIIDLSETGAQPMVSEDKTLRVTFNGEIYNHREIRKELEGKGHRFVSESDTEVLLHLYLEKGRDMVDSLRGMYAFALWDGRRRGLLLGRDPFGIKPLYFSDDGGVLRAASQVKALLAGGCIDESADPAGHAGFYLLGYVPEPFTLYNGIRTLPAGTTLWVDEAGRQESSRFFSIGGEWAAAHSNRKTLEPAQRREMVHDALLDSIRRHLLADVPVGLFLSAGIDSTTLAALAKEAGIGPLRSMTLGFDELRGTRDDEVPIAGGIAGQYGTSHSFRYIEAREFREDFPKIMAAMDQPSFDGVNTYFISKVAAETGLKVALSGLGGDELFGKYPSFRDIPRIFSAFGWSRWVPGLGRAFRIVTSPAIRRFTSPKYAGLLEFGGSYSAAYLIRRALFMPWELPEVLEPEMAREGWRRLQPALRIRDSAGDAPGSFPAVAAMEMSWYMRGQLLRDADWAGMAHSLEIRVPYVDVPAFRALAPLLASDSPPRKAELALAPLKPPPVEVVRRAKTGFTVPVRRWLMRETGIRERGLRGWARVVMRSFAGK